MIKKNASSHLKTKVDTHVMDEHRSVKSAEMIVRQQASPTPMELSLPFAPTLPPEQHQLINHKAEQCQDGACTPPAERAAATLRHCVSRRDMDVRLAAASESCSRHQ